MQKAQVPVYPVQSFRAGRLSVSELIDIKLKWAAIMLADELSYSNAAKRLNVTPSELKKQVVELETQLCFHIFLPNQEHIEVTDEGRFFLSACRKVSVLHDPFRS